jgi:hypothetical protein
LADKQQLHTTINARRIHLQGTTMKLRAGDWVEIRSKEEILRSLDNTGRLDELPFMPQMFEYSGQRFKVLKRAHKTCDTVTVGRGPSSRALSNGVHLDLRCDGRAYGGCQAACLIFWKEAWLKPVNEHGQTEDRIAVDEGRQESGSPGRGCSEQDVWTGTKQTSSPTDEIKYSCQATDLPTFTAPLRWWDVRQYVEDYTSGNVTLRQLIAGFVYLTYYHLTLAKRGRPGRPAQWLYDKFQALVGGVPFPRRRGTIPAGEPTPFSTLNLEPGELVRVKPYADILATLDVRSKNRGMVFDAEMVAYCGGTYRVMARIDRFVDEKSGKLLTLKTPALMLENVWCQARYSNCRMFCPRRIYHWWREIWLERV